MRTFWSRGGSRSLARCLVPTTSLHLNVEQVPPSSGSYYLADNYNALFNVKNVRSLGAWQAFQHMQSEIVHFVPHMNKAMQPHNKAGPSKREYWRHGVPECFPAPALPEWRASWSGKSSTFVGSVKIDEAVLHESRQRWIKKRLCSPWTE